MPAWNWNGARWWKFDFHTHTPASHDYGKGQHQQRLRARTPREWLLDFMRAGIDCVAVTDHNSGDWIDTLKEAIEQLRSDQPEGYRELYLFPGVEISVNGGVHVLAVFDGTATTSTIDRLLGAVAYEGEKGRSDSVTTRSFPEVITAVVNAGGIAIPAHVDQDNGILSTLSGTTLKRALECPEIFAMEVVDRNWTKPPIYADAKFAWAEILGSDSHHPDGNSGQRFPGSHFTWVKMGQPAIEGLHLALLDGALSVKRSDEHKEDPNGHGALMIESFEVTKARYMGRGSPFCVKFSPWLNAIIGGRGTGKSTLVEFLRMALRRDEELPGALTADFLKYRKAYASREEDGLLTRDTLFSVVYRKDGVRYQISWTNQSASDAITVDDGMGSWKSEQGDVAQRFPVRIYSQKQIFELAKDPLALLRIVDEASAVDRSSWEERWRAEQNRFLSLQADARRVEAELADEARLSGEIEDVKRKLEAFEGTDHAVVLKEYQRRERQSGVVKKWEAAWSSVAGRLRQSAQEIVPKPIDSTAFDDADDSDRDLVAKSSTLVEGLKQIQAKLEALAVEFDNVSSQWKIDLDSSQWKTSLDQALHVYEQLRDKLKEQGAGDPSAYGELVRRRQEIEARLAEFEQRRKVLEVLRKDASDCLAVLLAGWRQDLTKRRKAFIESVLAQSPYVKIKVIPYGARESVEPEIRRLIQRETGGFEKDIGTTDGGDSLLGNLYHGNPDATEFERRLQGLKDKLHAIAAGRHNAFDLKDQRFGAHINKLPPEALDRLDAWFPEDSLQVEYSTGADGSSFRSIQEGSPGQKTAALLAFLLSYGEEPIILDQPEDDLDNHLVYSLIVKQLRTIKERRQVIVVTHNANIVVNGDAELVEALAARSGETQHEAQGSLQQRAVREIICNVMEGGREAFDQRYRRISLGRQAGAGTPVTRSAGG